MDKGIRTLELLKRLNHVKGGVVKSVGVEFGGYEYNGRGVGMGRSLLGVMLYGRKLNNKIVLSNGAH